MTSNRLSLWIINIHTLSGWWFFKCLTGQKQHSASHQSPSQVNTGVRCVRHNPALNNPENQKSSVISYVFPCQPLQILYSLLFELGSVNICNTIATTQQWPGNHPQCPTSLVCLKKNVFNPLQVLDWSLCSVYCTSKNEHEWNKYFFICILYMTSGRLEKHHLNTSRIWNQKHIQSTLQSTCLKLKRHHSVVCSDVNGGRLKTKRFILMFETFTFETLS